MKQKTPRNYFVCFCITLMLMALFDCSCQNEPTVTDKDKIIGTWLSKTLTSSSNVVSFYRDDSIKVFSQGEYLPPTTNYGNYQIHENNIMELALTNNAQTNFGLYQFFNNDNSLIFNVGGYSSKYDRL